MSSLSSLADFSKHLASRREAILEAWRTLSLGDPVLTTGLTLTRDQFRDHIPQVLEALQHKLRNLASGSKTAQANEEIRREEEKHGLQRWQQGFRLEELMREWGILHLCLARELESYAEAHPQWSGPDQWAAGRELILLVNEGIAASLSRYTELERAGAAGKVADLTQVLEQLGRLEARRSQLLHQAVHDLRGNVQSMGNLAMLLGSEEVSQGERLEYATLLQDSVMVLGGMATELLELSRLEAGQEQRVVAAFDAAQLAFELCRLNEPRAKERQLYLRYHGPGALPVEGDAGKVRRLVQNLLLNALKYTEQGGVTVTWGIEPKHWWLIVQDTGPGLLAGPGSPLAKGMREATESAREADKAAADSAGRKSSVLNQADAGSRAPMPSHQQTGEGIGLSIVKRLCELLDASIELTSSADSGTTVRVLFPLSYPAKQ